MIRSRFIRRFSLPLALLTLGAAGCDSVFEVDNPNQLAQENLELPQSATALVNGTESAVARAVGQVLLPHSIASDELTAIGSLDYGRHIDYGFLSNPANDITNSAFPYVAEGRFMADLAISRLEQFDSQSLLRNRADLARAYLYGGVIYTTIADTYDDFVISPQGGAEPPIGEAAMNTLYATAVGSLDKGVALARATGNSTLELDLLAQRARTRHALAVWGLLNPQGQAVTSPLVSDAQAEADARAALLLAPSGGWKLQFEYSAGTVSTFLGSQVNVRQEYRVSDSYAVATADNKRVESIRLLDPIDHVTDPALSGIVNAFVADGEYPATTVVSARELYLILAEGALARGDTDEAAAQINKLRALDGLTPYSGQIPLLDLLRHERRVNLFLQGRRLADEYRFGVVDPSWQANSDAATAPGTFLPIAEVERLSNCHILGSC
jgi:hypothetical protein